MSMNYQEKQENKDGLYCYKCNVPLISEKVFLSYLRNTFPTQLLRCPSCGITLIEEELALTKALEVERTVEEK